MRRTGRPLIGWSAPGREEASTSPAMRRRRPATLRCAPAIARARNSSSTGHGEIHPRTARGCDTAASRLDGDRGSLPGHPRGRGARRGPGLDAQAVCPRAGPRSGGRAHPAPAAPPSEATWRLGAHRLAAATMQVFPLFCPRRCGSSPSSPMWVPLSASSNTSASPQSDPNRPARGPPHREEETHRGLPNKYFPTRRGPTQSLPSPHRGDATLATPHRNILSFSDRGICR